MLTGIAEEARDYQADDGGQPRHAGAEFVLRVDAYRIQVQFDGRATDIRPGSRVTVRGPLELVGEYEWEAFRLVDTRADWYVNEVEPLGRAGAMRDLVPANLD
jgi:hypothetical protein